MSKKTPEGQIITDADWQRARDEFVRVIDLLATCGQRERHDALVSFGRCVLGFDGLVLVSVSLTEEGADVETAVQITQEIAPAVPLVVEILRNLATRIETENPSSKTPEYTVLYDSRGDTKPRGQA